MNISFQLPFLEQNAVENQISLFNQMEEEGGAQTIQEQMVSLSISQQEPQKIVEEEQRTRVDLGSGSEELQQDSQK